MHELVRRTAWTALAALVLSVVTAGAAAAQYREFSGKIDKINKKQMIVDNRMGDKLKFDRLKETEVEDTHEGKKEEWKQLKKNDWVTVSWKMMDKPRKAYKVIVIPPRREAGEDL